MKALRRWLWQLRASLTRDFGSARFESEMEDHIAFATAENMRAGFDAAEARRRAVLKFGSLTAARESYRDGGGLPGFELLLGDFRYALRRLSNAPLFSLTTVLTIGLGMGATTAIFSLVYAVLLKSLSVANPAESARDLQPDRSKRACAWSCSSGSALTGRKWIAMSTPCCRGRR